MNIDAVITQLKTYCPVFQGRIAGAAAYGGANDEVKGTGLESIVNMQLPAAYVIPLEDMADPNHDLTYLHQNVTERIAVILHIDNSLSAGGDRRGQGSVDQVEALKYDVFKAILNWKIDTVRSSMSIMYAGGKLLHLDRARLFWQLEFELPVQLDGLNDGFVVTAVPITDISTTFPGYPTLTLDSPIDQTP